MWLVSEMIPLGRIKLASGLLSTSSRLFLFLSEETPRPSSFSLTLLPSLLLFTSSFQREMNFSGLREGRQWMEPLRQLECHCSYPIGLVIFLVSPSPSLSVSSSSSSPHSSCVSVCVASTSPRSSAPVDVLPCVRPLSRDVTPWIVASESSSPSQPSRFFMANENAFNAGYSVFDPTQNSVVTTV